MPKKHRHHHSSHRSLNGKNFIILPIVFSVIITGITAAIIVPAGMNFYNMASLFFSDISHDFSENYSNLYIPTAEGLEETSTPDSSDPSKQKTVPISSISYPYYGDMFGELIIEDCGVKANLFFGDGDYMLNNGVGIYTGSFIPGYGKPILVAGHNVTYFNGLKYAEKGQKILIRTSYGNYRYEITDVKVRNKDDKKAVDLAAQEEILTLYTCYPFDEIGLTPQRCFVYAKLVSGPVIDKTS